MLNERARWWMGLVAVAAAGCSAGAEGATPTSTPPVASTTIPAPTTEAPTTTEPTLDAGPEGEVQSFELVVDGVERTYRLYVPPRLGGISAAPHPLVVDLHGLGSDPDTHDMATGMRRLADEAGFAVAQPAARGDIPTWNGQPGAQGALADVTFMRAVVDDVATRHSIDSGAVFASGFSNGAGMAHRLACDAADMFAAIGTVSGQYPLLDSCDPEQPVAVLAFHGTEDLVVPITGVRRLLPDVTAWVAGWVERNGCAPVPLREQVAPDVVRDRWAGCDDGVEVVFLTIDGGPHAWPGSTSDGFFAPTQSIDASAVMWAFFSEHAR